MRIEYAFSKFICKAVKRSLAGNEGVDKVKCAEVIAAVAVCFNLRRTLPCSEVTSWQSLPLLDEEPQLRMALSCEEVLFPDWYRVLPRSPAGRQTSSSCK
jgi:hypothetical protein